MKRNKREKGALNPAQLFNFTPVVQNVNPTCERMLRRQKNTFDKSISESPQEKPVQPIQEFLAQKRKKKCSHSEGENENVLMELLFSFPALHPRPFLFNRLLEELNCAQLMHNKQMEPSAIAPEWRLRLFLSEALK